VNKSWLHINLVRNIVTTMYLLNFLLQIYLGLYFTQIFYKSCNLCQQKTSISPFKINIITYFLLYNVKLSPCVDKGLPNLLLLKAIWPLSVLLTSNSFFMKAVLLIIWLTNLRKKPNLNLSCKYLTCCWWTLSLPFSVLLYL